MTAQQYVRVDLWRYIKVEDEDIRSSFKFTVFVVNYIFYALMLCTTLAVILTDININVSIIANIFNAVIISYVREGNVIGNTIVDICLYRWNHTYGMTSGMYLYNTKKAKRETRTLVSVIYNVIFCELVLNMGYILYMDNSGPIDKLTQLIFFILFYVFVYWMHPKAIKRRLNLIFGV